MLLVGVRDDDSTVVGLSRDYDSVKPANGDGFVNWLTTHLMNALGSVPAVGTRARIDFLDGREVCRVDVAQSSTPVWAMTRKDERAFFVRMNNTTRALEESEATAYIREKWQEPEWQQGSSLQFSRAQRHSWDF